jgi:hypothetical protein
MGSVDADVLCSGICEADSAVIAALDGCARALISCPASGHVSLLVSQACVQTWSAYNAQGNARGKLRSHGRPFLGLISKLISARTLAGGSCEIVEVDTSDSVDKLAMQCASKRLLATLDSTITRLPAELGEQAVSLWHKDKLVIADVRKAAVLVMQAQSREDWAESESQGEFAGSCAQWLFTQVCRERWAGGDRFALRLLTDTLYWRADKDSDGATVLTELRCGDCDAVDTIAHVGTCQSADATRIAAEVLDELRILFEASGTCNKWVSESTTLVTFLNELVGYKLRPGCVRCGLLDGVIWKTCVDCIWSDHADVDLVDVRLQTCKLLYESVFAVWRSRHDVMSFL